MCREAAAKAASRPSPRAIGRSTTKKIVYLGGKSGDNNSYSGEKKSGKYLGGLEELVAISRYAAIYRLGGRRRGRAEKEHGASTATPILR